MKNLCLLLLLSSSLCCAYAQAQTSASLQVNNVSVKVNNIQTTGFRYPHQITVNLEDAKTKDTLQMQYEINLQKAYQEMNPTMMYKMNGGVARTVFKNIRMETLGFLAGVGFNSLKTLLLDYNKDPMATEKFIETLKDPVGYLGLAAFIFTNNYSGNALNSLLYSQFMSKVTSAGIQQGLAHYLVPQLGMAMGGLASNALHDIAYLTKSCAAAIANKNIMQSQKAKVCDEAMKMTFSSEKFYDYTTQTFSMVSAGFFIAATEKASVFAKDKALNAVYKKVGLKVFMRQALTLRGISIAASRVGRFIPNPVFKIIASGLNLAVFMNVDEHISFPIWNDYIQKNFKAGPELIESRDYVQQRLAGTAIQAKDKDIANLDFVFNKKSYSLLSILEGQPENDANTDMQGALKAYREDSKVWREKLMESFTTPYMNWLTKTARFASLASMTQSYYSDFTSTMDSYYSAQKNPNLVEAMHPFYFDNAYYGVIPRDANGKIVKEDSITLVEQLNSYKLNTLKAAVPMIQRALTLNAPTIDPKTKQKRNLNVRKFIQTALEKMKYAFSTTRKDLHQQALIDLAYLNQYYSGDAALNVSESVYLGSNPNPAANDSLYFTSQESILKQIYRFVGEPLPLGRGELYAFERSQYFQETQPAFYKELGPVPGYELMKAIVCGPDQVGIRNSYYLPGTSLVFTPPNLMLNQNLSERKSLCAAPGGMSSLVPSEIQLQKRTYNTSPTALLDFAIRNMNPTVLKVHGGDFDTWWLTHVYPSIEKVYDTFNTSYLEMVKENLIPKFQAVSPTEKGLALDVTTAYRMEAETYLSLLQKSYLPKDESEKRLFVRLLSAYRNSLLDMLNAYRKKSDVRTQYVQTLALYKMIKRLFTFSDNEFAINKLILTLPEDIKRKVLDRFSYYSQIAGTTPAGSYEYMNSLELRLVLDKWMDDQIYEDALSPLATRYAGLSPMTLNAKMKGDGATAVRATLDLMMELHEDIYQISDMMESLSNEKNYSGLQQKFELKKGSGSRKWGP